MMPVTSDFTIKLHLAKSVYSSFPDLATGTVFAAEIWAETRFLITLIIAILSMINTQFWSVWGGSLLLPNAQLQRKNETEASHVDF